MLPANIYTFTIAAGQTSRQQLKGKYFKILLATGTVTVKSDFGTLKDLIAGQGLEQTPFEYLTFENTSGASNTIRLFVGDQVFVDGLKGTVDIGTMAQPTSSTFANTAATVTSASAQLVAAAPGRKYILIQNNDLAGYIVISFGAAATLTNGIVINPGEAYEMNFVQSTQAIFAIGNIASNTKIVVVTG